MFNENAEQSFITSAGDSRGTSVYRVCKNGVIRAKTATKKIHVRRGKNMYFLKNADADAVLDGLEKMPVHSVIRTGDDYALWLGREPERGFALTLTPKGAHQTPLDLFLKIDGRAESACGIHVGHAIGGGFDGGDSGLNESQIGKSIDSKLDSEGLIRENVANANYDID